MPGAGIGFWSDVATDVSTYVALASTFFFARPVLRNQHTQARLLVLEAAEGDSSRKEAIRKDALDTLRSEMVDGFLPTSVIMSSAVRFLHSLAYS